MFPDTVMLIRAPTTKPCTADVIVDRPATAAVEEVMAMTREAAPPKALNPTDVLFVPAATCAVALSTVGDTARVMVGG